MERQRNKPQIIYIAGAGHSGTTLMDFILDAPANTFSVGELKFLKRFINKEKIQNFEKFEYRDDTGTLLEESEVWGSVVSGSKKFINDDVENAELSLYEKIKLLLLGTVSLRKEIYKNQALYLEIFKNAENVTGEAVTYIIDSSKNLPQLIALKQHTDFDIFVVHIIRDVRGAVYSAYRRGYPQVWRIARRWFLINLFLIKYLQKNFDDEKYTQIWYEDFADSQKKYLDIIKEKTGISVDYEGLIDDVENKPSYRFYGNPMRMEQFTGIRKDVRWQKEFPVRYQLLLFPIQYLIKVKIK